ncbi:hypothetical protein AtNW77_Chr4g0301441 [Arabidopsis thaliana]|jgi:hypothetical protein|uniref:At4g24275 n=3 Tax=Arabidopsis TaxID=3701 RepID=Q84R17_ARATH|nr:uncharacterized protein AT4G24275 [Arabidopsis thaliana]KAG7617148.1 hypothetical protein ISN45_At04g025540 [Arabidopsis thaliana x Arabidopsis arenosa]AAP04153.1 unknown protein [Arabidopsis thaliana]AAV84514.1 At4g24275 [Arabidopsis thaliana]ABG48448.1 At4g24275 [Arabidopsis thaliana]AEE84883.1 hypothetical protein AT4G24275 [Arabidopsis thaliana]|eukprot:NP_680737.2 hypothetical protein AT4G24275 [Arabidopsis thaliana]
MSGYSKMDSTDQKLEPDHPVVDPQIQKPDLEPAEMKPKLSRNRSVSASAQAVPSPIKMSMRRSSSVSERYCRIYDQSSATTWPLPFHEGDEDEDDDDKEKVHKKKKSNNFKKKAFVKACKRFFGIS